MTGQLYINNKDAYATWGVCMDNQCLSTLLTPQANKESIRNTSRLLDGDIVISTNPKMASRDLTLTLNLIASSDEDFFDKYSAFCTELNAGTLNIKTSFQPDVTYKMIYLSCTQFTQFQRGIAKFSLKVTEPNPNDRS